MPYFSAYIYLFLVDISNATMLLRKIDYTYDGCVNSKKKRKFQDMILAWMNTLTHILIGWMFKNPCMQM